MAIEESGFINVVPVLLRGGRGFFELVDAGAPLWVPDDLPHDTVTLHGVKQYFTARVYRWGNRAFVPVEDFPAEEAEEWL